MKDMNLPQNAPVSTIDFCTDNGQNIRKFVSLFWVINIYPLGTED